jgi:hypothetical protein
MVGSLGKYLLMPHNEVNITNSFGFFINRFKLQVEVSDKEDHSKLQDIGCFNLGKTIQT